VAYHDLWPGIDLVYGGANGHLKYSFVVQPGADPSRIRLDYRGPTDVRLTEDGGLRVETPLGGFTDQRPYAYQDRDGRQQQVDASFALEADPEAGAFVSGFSVGTYDPSLPLVLDPVVLGYAGFIGGAGLDSASDIAVDSSGNAYIAGESDNATGFPLTVGPDTSYNGGFKDVFVAKLNPTGTGFVYCGFIGGDKEEDSSGIAVDGSGRAVVVGYTLSFSPSFPARVGPRLTRSNAETTGFVARVNAAGTGLDYAGYIGGEGTASADAVAVDSGGNAYVAGTANGQQSQFGAKVGPDLTYAGGPGFEDQFNPSLSFPGGDAFIVKVKPDGSDFVYAGFIGGTADDLAEGISVDSTGAAYVTGGTVLFSNGGKNTVASMNFPVVVGPSATAHTMSEGWVAKVRPDGTGFVYAGYLGITTNGSKARDVAVDGAGFAYVTGSVRRAEAGSDAFVAKVAQNGSGIADLGFIAGNSTQGGIAIAVDSVGTIYVVGSTTSDQLSPPATGGPDLTFNGDFDTFVAKINPNGGGFAYLGYIGGSVSDYPYGAAIDGSGNLYVAGGFDSYNRGFDFPATVGPDSSFNGGQFDAWVAKLVSAPQPSLSIGNVSGSEGDAGSGPLAFTVTLSAPSSETVTVQYATSNGQATGGSCTTSFVDYQTTSGTLTFNPGQTTRTIQVPICGDTQNEPDETFLVGLSNPTGATIATSGATGTIVNDDVPAVQISAADATIGEGNSGTKIVNFPVNLSYPNDTYTVTAQYATSSVSATGGGSCGAGIDYVTTSGTVSFPVGSTSGQVIPVTICGDVSSEGNETFQVTLSSLNNAQPGRLQATGTISDDDNTLPRITIDDAIASEAAPSLVFNVRLSAPSPSAVTVQYLTQDGTAKGGGCPNGDYFDASGTVTFPANNNAPQVIQVMPCNDATAEYGETFFVNLSNASGATIDDGQANGLILDDNDPRPSISIGDQTFAEGDAGLRQFDFIVSMSATSGQPISVNYATADVTATASQDYLATSGTLTFQPGDIAKHVIVSVSGDTAIEDDETFTVTLTSPTFATLADPQAIGTIQNDDTPSSMAITAGARAEGDNDQDSVAFTVTLSAASTQTVTVNYATANGTATGGASCTDGVDYVTASGPLTFEPGATIRSVPVTICGDHLFEPDETFSMTLSGASNAAIGTATATTTITNDDVQPQAPPPPATPPTLSIADVTVAEGNAGTTTASFAVTLSAASSSPVTVAYATANGTATAGACGSGGDYVASNGTLTFNPGQTSRAIDVAVCGDTTEEPGETFTVTLSTPSGATLGRAQATGTITNDDTTVTPPAPPSPPGPSSACAPRPNPVLTVTHAPEPGRLQVTITASTSALNPSNALQQIQVGGTKNALVEVPGARAGTAGPLTLQVSGAQTTFFVQRQAPGDFRVDLEFMDGCSSVAGPFRTFVGGGPSVP
jgi:hypothetical protein